ncbi:MAG: acyltransferase [Crocinitomicaceae bacterium]|nr:acyltransferase [Crocinitomicaceae bacterium]
MELFLYFYTEYCIMTYIKGFNAVRAFSVLLVVLTHLDLSDWIPNTDFVMSRVWPMMSGEFGVLTFFVLSGYLITSILLHEKEKNGRISLKNFYIRRALRLFPPLILFFVLMGIVYTAGYMSDAVYSVLYGVFYLYNYVPRTIYFSEMGHLWSLGVEEQFYILWPLILLYVKKLEMVKRIGYVLIAISCVFAFVVAYYALFQNYYPTRWFIPASTSIIVGCLMAILNFTQPDKARKWALSPYTFLLILLTYSFTLYVPPIFVSLGFFFRSIAVGLVLLIIVHSQDKKWVNVLEFKPLAYIGIISYGIYIYQGFFLRTGGGSEIWFQKFPLNIILAVALAIVSYEFIEKPILKFKKKFEHR